MKNTHNALLDIKHFGVTFHQYDKNDSKERDINIPVITDLSLWIEPGEIFAVVGSSGSGKSLLAHGILGILPKNADIYGDIYFRGNHLASEDLNNMRGHEIAFIPQGTDYTDPLLTAEETVLGTKKDDISIKKAQQLLSTYGLTEDDYKKYPGELSGGMIRRVLMSTALMDTPALLIADEPTPGLDLKRALQTMSYFRDYAKKGNGVLLITHDLELAIKTSDRIGVFYGGTTVEITAAENFKKEENLLHPYTKALWRAMPEHGFNPLLGNQPYPGEITSGCPFRNRCDKSTEMCRSEIPFMRNKNRLVRCIVPDTYPEG